ncbi:uncharacterized protein LOC144487144 [Mustelus asterias]
MATQFQIAEFYPDPFEAVPRAGAERSEEEGSDGGSPERRPSGVRGRRVEVSEVVAFPDGGCVTRRMTLPEEELLEDMGSFRGRTRSEPPNFWLAVQYGRELRRMSDEFVSSFNEAKVILLPLVLSQYWNTASAVDNSWLMKLRARIRIPPRPCEKFGLEKKDNSVETLCLPLIRTDS